MHIHNIYIYYVYTLYIYTHSHSQFPEPSNPLKNFVTGPRSQLGYVACPKLGDQTLEIPIPYAGWVYWSCIWITYL
jgi:hypothetical protein